MISLTKFRFMDLGIILEMNKFCFETVLNFFLIHIFCLDFISAQTYVPRFHAR
jgi:hypothetical protein